MADFKINAKINTKVIGDAARDLDKIRGSLLNMTSVLPEIAVETEAEFAKVGAELDSLSKRAIKGLQDGSFQDPAFTQRYLEDLRKQQVEVEKLTESIILKNTTTLEEKNAIEQTTAQIIKKEKALAKEELKLEAIMEKTKLLSELERDVASKLGISPETLRDPDQLKAQISQRTTDSGQPKNKQAEKDLVFLNEVAEAQKRIQEEAGNILEKEKKVTAQVQLHASEVDQLKNKRRDQMIQAIKNNKKLLPQEKEKYYQLINQGQALNQIEKSIRSQSYKQRTEQIKNATKANKKHTQSLHNKKKSFLQNVTAATLYYTALRVVRQVISSVTSVMNDLDKSFTEIAMVSNMNRQEAWAMVDAYQNLATQVGTTTSEVAKLAVFFARQGRSAAEAFELTKVAAMAAKVASIDATESANYLTSAINGFRLSVDQAMDISDKFAALGASSASSYQEMAVALSKVAPSAKVAGVNIDQMLGFLAKGIETTREAPENIGTAFKTVFARMTQLRDFGKTLEEGVAVNTVEEALRTAGVALRDNQGNFRDMGQVLTELGYKFEGLTRNQQAYIATALAGTRQQSRLLAVLQDFDRTMELVDVSLDASGATMAQHAEYAGGMEAASARLANAWQKVITNFIEADVVIGIVKVLTGLMNFLATAVDNFVPIVMAAVGALMIFKATTILTAASAIRIFITHTLAAKTGLIAKTIATYKAAIAAKAYGVAMTMALGVVGLVIGAIWLLVKAFTAQSKEAEKLAEEINQLQVDMYNLNKEAKDFTALVDRFKELQKQSFKTSEELKEMEDILSKIEQYGGSQYDFILAGQLDMEAVELFMEAKKLEAAAKNEELREAGGEEVRRVIRRRGEKGDRDDITSGTETAVTEYLVKQLYKDYEQLTEEEQKLMKTMVYKNMDYYLDLLEERSLRYSNMAGNIYLIETEQLEVDREILDLAQDYNKILQGVATKGEQQSFFDGYFGLDPQQKEELKRMYGGLLTNILQFGQKTINDFISGGFDLTQMEELTDSIESALEGLTVTRFAGSSQGAVEYQDNMADDIAKFYTATLASLDPEDLNASNEALSRTIEQIRALGLTASVEDEYIRKLVNTLTDPMAFNSGMNAVREATNSIQALMDASEQMANGQLPDNIEQLLQAYPALASQIMDGSLTIEEAYDAVAGSLTGKLGQQLGQLRQQLAVSVGEDAKRIQAQIDLLEKYADNPALLMNQEEMIEDATKDMEDRYQSEINFIKSLNDAKKQEIDLMKQKIDMNKSMLEIDRQIAALARDTSYGAQAKLQDLRDEQRNQAIEREKFVMDLITEQAISELEEESRRAVLKISDNVQVIVDQITGGASGSNGSFNGTTGESPI